MTSRKALDGSLLYNAKTALFAMFAGLCVAQSSVAAVAKVWIGAISPTGGLQSGSCANRGVGLHETDVL